MDDTVKVKRVALLSIVFSFLVLFLKFAAYWYTGSVSVLSDALESFVNVASTIFSYFIIILAKAPADKNHQYGHQKAEFFASGVEGILVFLAGVAISAYAIEKLLHGYQLKSIGVGIYISIVASILNGIIAKILMDTAKKHGSIALEANARHILTDIWTTAIVVIGLIIINYLPDYSWIDPVLAIMLSLFIFYTGAILIKRSVDGLMDVALPDTEVKEINSIIDSSIPKGSKIKDFRSRTQGSNRAIDFKLMLDAKMTVKEAHDICDLLEGNISKVFPGTITIIHVEPIE